MQWYFLICTIMVTSETVDFKSEEKYVTFVIYGMVKAKSDSTISTLT